MEITLYTIKLVILKQLNVLMFYEHIMLWIDRQQIPENTEEQVVLQQGSDPALTPHQPNENHQPPHQLHQPDPEPHHNGR